MPKIFLYLSSLIGVLFILTGGIVYSFVSQNNNSQPQVNVIQEEEKKEINQKENKEEIQKEEKNKEPEKNEIEEENKIFKVLYITMLVIFVLLVVIEIYIEILSVCDAWKFNSDNDKDKKNVDEIKKRALINFIITIILQLSMLLCSFLIKGKTISIIMFILEVLMYISWCCCKDIAEKKIKKINNMSRI